MHRIFTSQICGMFQPNLDYYALQIIDVRLHRSDYYI